ncbi:patatin-like phospholipase family protein [Cyanobacteria bacterium FACHB-472]|nr:patatin-like phospholipase family protein [Cyanobacteria bacterium FACHB-472]
MSRLIKVLSIDGGGIRGIIPAMILAEIEQITSKPIAELFHLIAGTSTGGILALGLTKPNGGGKPEHPAANLVRLYEKEGSRIFPQSNFTKLKNLQDEKYPSDGIERVLEEYFGETMIGEALTEILIPSYDIELRRPYFFKRTKARKNPKCHNFYMKKVARATSAAPTYFEPLKLETNDLTDYYALIDGGVFANNPAMCAYVQAKSNYPDAIDFLIVSIGTGELTTILPYEKVKDWGLLQWAQPIIHVTFDGVSDTVHYQLKQLLPPVRDQRRYYRFQTRLTERGDHMDDASKENIRALKLQAESIINDNEENLQMLSNQLLSAAS